MSRVIIKNLPKKVTKDCLREVFDKIGQINDINLLRKNGVFRGVAFIGYETAEFADQACEELNNTFLKGGKISVELAKTFAGKSDDQDESQGRSFDFVIKKWKEPHIAKFRITVGKNLRGLKKEIIVEFLHPIIAKIIFIPRKCKLLAYVAFDSEDDFQKIINKKNCSIKGNAVDISEVAQEKIEPWYLAEKKLQQANPVSESAKIFIRNLSYTVIEDDLRECFEKIGPIRGLSLPFCRMTSTSKGFAHISFMFPEHAVKALHLNGTVLKGRYMHIIPSNIDEEEEIEAAPFQKHKEKELKEKASSWHNWNMLFLAKNAVLNIMAQSNDTTKLKMLEDNEPNLAVNLALQETDIVQNTKKFLEDNGVSLDAFSNPGMKRSRCVILVKDLPENTTAEEVHETFNKFGDLNRVLLPEHGLTAIVEFMHEDNAATAFKKMAYKQFKYLPLYLEWAPIQIFKQQTEDTTQNSKTESKEIMKKNKRQRIKEEDKDNAEPEEIITEPEIIPESNTTLYVKNINFSTTEERLKEFFSSCGKVYSALITKQKGLSQGYGFVQYFKASHAKKAHLQFQGSNLDEHRLLVEMSKNFIPNETSFRRAKHDPGKKTVPKIMVKNIPFQATRKEIKEIFKPYGSLRATRLPNKPGNEGEHRGFCFIEFSAMEDAERAFNGLSASTHLYDRRLVLEWAKEDESVEELMQRTAKNFMASGPPRKKLKRANNENVYEDIM